MRNSRILVSSSTATHEQTSHLPRDLPPYKSSTRRLQFSLSRIYAGWIIDRVGRYAMYHRYALDSWTTSSSREDVMRMFSFFFFLFSFFFSRDDQPFALFRSIEPTSPDLVKFFTADLRFRTNWRIKVLYFNILRIFTYKEEKYNRIWFDQGTNVTITCSHLLIFLSSIVDLITNFVIQ